MTKALEANEGHSFLHDVLCASTMMHIFQIVIRELSKAKQRFPRMILARHTRQNILKARSSTCWTCWQHVDSLLKAAGWGQLSSLRGRMLQGHACKGALKTLGGFGRGVIVVIWRIRMLRVLQPAVILPQDIHAAQTLAHAIAEPILIALCIKIGFQSCNTLAYHVAILTKQAPEDHALLDLFGNSRIMARQHTGYFHN